MTVNVNSGMIPSDGSYLTLLVPPGEVLVDAYCELPGGEIHRSTDDVMTLRYNRDENGKVITVDYLRGPVAVSGDVTGYLLSIP